MKKQKQEVKGAVEKEVEEVLNIENQISISDIFVCLSNSESDTQKLKLNCDFSVYLIETCY